MITVCSYDPAVLTEYEFIKTPGDPPIQPMLCIIHENNIEAANHFYILQPIASILSCRMTQDKNMIHVGFPLYDTNTLMTILGTFYSYWIPSNAVHEVKDKVVYSTTIWTK
jgi:hypothetical protein